MAEAGPAVEGLGPGRPFVDVDRRPINVAVSQKAAFIPPHFPLGRCQTGWSFPRPSFRVLSTLQGDHRRQPRVNLNTTWTGQEPLTTVGKGKQVSAARGGFRESAPETSMLGPMLRAKGKHMQTLDKNPIRFRDSGWMMNDKMSPWIICTKRNISHPTLPRFCF